MVDGRARTVRIGANRSVGGGERLDALPQLPRPHVGLSRQGVTDQATDLESRRIGHAVAHVHPVAAAGDDPRPPQHRQVLGDVGLAAADPLGQVADADLAALQLVEDAKPGRVRERLEALGEPDEQVVGGACARYRTL